MAISGKKNNDYCDLCSCAAELVLLGPKEIKTTTAKTVRNMHNQFTFGILGYQE